MTEREVRSLLYPARPDSAVTPLGRVEGESSTVLTGQTALIGVVAGIDTTTRPEPAPHPRLLHSIGWWA